MDYDGDGRDDLITGSYTGQLYLFRRAADGSFGPRELLVDEAGETLMMADYSVVPELVDMDADGDLDLVVGARTDPVRVIENVGTRTAPAWAKARKDLTTTKGGGIVGSNAHHADWDGDGVRDLLVGSEWGEVRWYRNVGANDAPKYGPGEVLVTKCDYNRDPEGSTPKRPGLRVKVHVTDWNGDGRPDLLLGDVTWQQSTPEPLTADEAAEQAKLEAEAARLQKELARVAAGAERDRLAAAIDEQRTKLRAYDRTKLHTHGWVWLYLRKGVAGPPR